MAKLYEIIVNDSELEALQGLTDELEAQIEKETITDFLEESRHMTEPAWDDIQDLVKNYTDVLEANKSVLKKLESPLEYSGQPEPKVIEPTQAQMGALFRSYYKMYLEVTKDIRKDHEDTNTPRDEWEHFALPVKQIDDIIGHFVEQVDNFLEGEDELVQKLLDYPAK